jgi:phosphoenolpyruvate phosphomutase
MLGEAAELLKGLEGINGSVLVAYGDVLFQKFIPMHLFDSDSDFCIAVDPKDVPADERDGYRDLVMSDRPFDWSEFDRPTRLVRMSAAIAPGEAHGEWMGLLKLSATGVTQLRDLCASIPDAERLRTMRMSDVFDLLLADGKSVEVVYVRGHWLDVDDMHDILAASNFDGSGQYR